MADSRNDWRGNGNKNEGRQLQLDRVREFEDDIRKHVVGDRDDHLAVWGRILLALAHDRRPDPEDLRRVRESVRSENRYR